MWSKPRVADAEAGSFRDRSSIAWCLGHAGSTSDVIEYIGPRRADEPGMHRLRGRVPPDAHTLRWYYGMVADPYPLTIPARRRASITETVAGDAWTGRSISRTISRRVAPADERQAPMRSCSPLRRRVALRVMRKKTILSSRDSWSRELRGFTALLRNRPLGTNSNALTVLSAAYNRALRILHDAVHPVELAGSQPCLPQTAQIYLAVRQLNFSTRIVLVNRQSTRTGSVPLREMFTSTGSSRCAVRGGSSGFVEHFDARCPSRSMM